MKNLRLVLTGSLVLVILVSFIFTSSSSFAGKDEHAKETVQGNIFCLIPDRDKGTFKPVVANEPCTGKQPHAHVIVGIKDEHKGFVYAVQGSQKTIEKLEKRKDRTDVKVEGKIRRTERGWILRMG